MHKVLRFYFTFFVILFLCNFNSKAQLSSADSVFFNGIFSSPKYVDDSVYLGNFYINDPIVSMYHHYIYLDTSFKFKTNIFDSIENLTILDTMQFDTLRNNSFNSNPTLLNGQQNPMIYVPYSLNNNYSKTYSFYYPDTNNLGNCKSAFLIVPGTGINASYDIVRNLGYHNLLCPMVDNCRNFGDVFTFIKPNEESRAVYWNGSKLGEYIVWYCGTQNTYYGTNYVIEMIAMIKYLKSKYDKVFLFGLSEGGYSAMLATMYIQPDAALISGGYTINFDTLWNEKGILRTRFDTLVDNFDKVKVRNIVANSKTQYLFTYGDGDNIEGMQMEHDSAYTQNYYSGLSNTSFFYNFNYHTFPPCSNIDTFINRVLEIPKPKFFIIDNSLPDTLKTRVDFCRNGLYRFDLYKNTVFIDSFTNVINSIDIPLYDTGSYYLKNIKNGLQVGSCDDTIFCDKIQIPAIVGNNVESRMFFEIINPFDRILNINLFNNDQKAIIQVFSVYGQKLIDQKYSGSEIKIPTENWPIGQYIIRVRDGNYTQDAKILKQ